MTKEEIFNLQPGEEANIAVATYVMNWHMIPPETDEDGIHWRLMWLDENNRMMHNDWFPSSDMADAWEVVLHLADRGYAPNLIYDDDGHWGLSFEGMQDVAPCTYVTAWIDEPELWCDTAPLAICRAALLVVMRWEWETD